VRSAWRGIDYDIESVAWLGKTTLIQDQRIMTDAQAGISSRSYTPGRFAQLEAGISDMHHDYLRDLRYGRSLALAKGPAIHGSSDPTQPRLPHRGIGGVAELTLETQPAGRPETTGRMLFSSRKW
jgi:hypothetical protein